MEDKSRYINHPDIIALCTDCERDSCPSDGCGEYKTIMNRLRKEDGKDRKKQSDYSAQKTPELLRDVCAAVAALEKLGANKDCNAVYPQAKVIRLCGEIKMARFNAFDAAIDWAAVASGMEVGND